MDPIFFFHSLSENAYDLSCKTMTGKQNKKQQPETREGSGVEKKWLHTYYKLYT